MISLNTFTSGVIITTTCTTLRRGVFYLADEGIKFALADVDIQNSRVEELFYYTDSAVPFKNSIIYPQNEIDENILARGFYSIRAHQKNLLVNFSLDKPIKLFGMANSLFAQVKNGQKFLDYLQKNTGIEFKCIGSDTHLQVKYDAAVAALGTEKSANMLLWDTSKDKSNSLVHKKNNKYLIKQITPTYSNFYLKLREMLKKKQTLNPMSEQEYEVALDFALKELEHNNISYDYIGDFNLIVGSGQVHTRTIQHYVNFEKIKNTTRETTDIDLWEYNKSDVKKAIEFLLNKPNGQIINFMHNKDGLLLVDQEISNIILTYAIMLKLNINKVQSLDCKEIFGVLLQK